MSDRSASIYEDERILERLSQNRSRLKTPRKITREVHLFIDISTYVSTGNRAGFEKWAQLNNLKEAAKTFNYLSEHNLLNYEEFQKHASDLQDSIIATDAEIQKVDSDISLQKLIQKHCTTYRECKKVVTAGKTASDINKIAIGKPLVFTPRAFPPLHTVRDSFPSHGVPPTKITF